MKKLTTIAALGAACALALSACSGSADKSGDSGSASASDYKACLVSDAGGWDDKSFNESAKIGLDEAAKEFGIKTNTAESSSDADFAPNTQSMIDDGCNLVIGVGFNLAAATTTAAQENSDLNFALVDSTFSDSAGKAIELPNGRPLLFNTQEAGYLAGYVAAGVTKTGKVATFGGMAIPSVTIFMDGFADGVKAYNEAKGTKVEVLGWNKEAQEGSFADSFEDQAKGKTLTEGFISQGADIVMPVAGPVGHGAAAAAQAAGNVYIIGVDSDWYESVPDYKAITLTSVMKQIGPAVKDTIKAGMDGKFSADPFVGTIANGGVGIAPFHDLDSAVPEDVKKEVKDLQAKIADGSLKIESPSANK